MGIEVPPIVIKRLAPSKSRDFTDPSQQQQQPPGPADDDDDDSGR
jgi:hypothetical protein